jgi:hypothetical protein
MLTDVRQHFHATALPLAHRLCQPFAKFFLSVLRSPSQYLCIKFFDDFVRNLDVLL